MSNTKEKLDWRKLLDEYENEKADGYILYLRRSIKRKKKNGVEVDEDEEKQERIDKVSIEQQREVCEHIARTRDLKIVATYEEQVSAKTPSKRSEFKKMLEHLSTSKKSLGVLAWAPDRLSRNAMEAGILIQLFLDKDIMDFQFATYHFNQDDTGVEYLMMEFARAMGYSLRLRKNVLRGMYKGFFDEGEWLFVDKFGYTSLLKTLPDGTRKRAKFPIPHEGNGVLMGEFETVQMAFNLRLKGYTLEKIATEINRKGFITKQGKRGKMTKQKLSGSKTRKGYLHDPFYYGLMEMGWGSKDISGRTVKDDDGEPVTFTPVVLKEVFDQVQLVNDKKANIKAKTHDDLPFRGQIFCGHCDGPLTPQNKKGYAYYYCYNSTCKANKAHSQSKKKAKNEGITGTALFNEIGKIIKKGFKLTKVEFTYYLASLEKQHQIKKQVRSTDLKRIAATKGHLRRQMKQKTSEFTAALGRLKNPNQKRIRAMQEEHDEAMAQLQKRFNAEHEKENHINQANHAWTQDLTRWLELMQKAHLYWQNATFEQKRVIAENLFLELKVKDGKLASFTYKKPYSTLEKANLSYNGGA